MVSLFVVYWVARFHCNILPVYLNLQKMHIAFLF